VLTTRSDTLLLSQRNKPRACAQAMHEVPVSFFSQDFDFGHPDTFASICGAGELLASQVRGAVVCVALCHTHGK
jgi:hypothetical protein